MEQEKITAQVTLIQAGNVLNTTSDNIQLRNIDEKTLELKLTTSHEYGEPINIKIIFNK